MDDDAIGVLITRFHDVGIQLRWAIRLATARRMDLYVFEAVESNEGRTVEIQLDEPSAANESAVAAEVLRIVASSPEVRVAAGADGAEGRGAAEDGHIIDVRLIQVRADTPRTFRELMLTEVRKGKLKLITSAYRELDTGDHERVRERQLFLRYVPCEVVYCFGLEPENDLERILAAVASGPHSSAAVRLAKDLAALPDCQMTAVRVNPNIGPDSERVGELRLDALLQKSLGYDDRSIRHRVVADDQFARGIRRVWEEGKNDLVVMGASRMGLLGSQITGGTAARVFKGDPKPAVAIVSAGSPIRGRFVGLLEGGLERLVPQIGRDDRVALVDRVQSSSNWDFDFLALMVLSTMIAAIGLIQNSAAVVIGAMLVAPLMTPMLGLGLSLVQGNLMLARISVRAIGYGLAVALLVGFLVGWLTPGFEEPTREMLGRGGPSILDLFVAFASGLAAAYASSRPGLLAALPGVAIAAALVPPIATSGLALSLGNLDLAFNALLLFIINMVTIVLASMTSLWAVGLRNIKKASQWTMLAGSAVLVSVLVLGIYLSLRPDTNPVARQAPVSLMETVGEMLGESHRLEGVSVAYDELGVQLNLRIEGDTVLPNALADDIRAAVRSNFDKAVRVRLVTSVAADPAIAD
jgi:uncharacterized hydrophobic protein (TIGR00271 family)